MRAVGWICVVLLAGGAIFASWFTRARLETPELSQSELEYVASLADDALPGWLTGYSKRVNAKSPDAHRQVLVVQVTPGSAPMVIANVRDREDREEASHWPVPWPGVVAALAAPKTEAFEVSDSYAGMNYFHRLMPVEPTGHRLILVTASQESPPWLGFRGLAAMLAVFLAIGLMSPKQDEG